MMDKIKIRASFPDPFQQEQAIHALIDHILLAKHDVSGEIDVLLALLTSSPPKQGPSAARTAGVCQGLELLVGKGKIEVNVAIKKILTVVETILSQQSAIPSLQHIISTLVSTLTSIGLYGVEESYSGGEGAAAAFRWSEQPPLALALSLNPSQMSTSVLNEIGLFSRNEISSLPSLVLPAWLGPVVSSILFEPQFAIFQSKMVQALALGPLDYLPQPAVLSLSILYAEFYTFLPYQTTEQLVLVNDWANFVFHWICHLEDSSHVERVSRPFVSQLLTHALTLIQGTSSTSPLPHFIILARLVEYAPSLMYDHLPLLAYLLTCSHPGPERSCLLFIIKCTLDYPGLPWGSKRRALLLRWILFPIITLVSLQNTEARPILALLEARFSKMMESSTMEEADEEAAIGNQGLERLLVEQSPASTVQAIQSTLSSLASDVKEISSFSSSSLAINDRNWILFLTMGTLFHPTNEVKTSALPCLSTLVQMDHFIGPKIVPSLLYLLNQWKGQISLQQSLLSLLPQLGLHQSGAQMVSSLLRRLPDLAREGEKVSQDKQSRVVLASASVTLIAALYRTNTRTLPRLRQLILSDSPVMEEMGEYRLAKVLAIRDVVQEDPEAGSEFVGILQTYLMDALPGIVAIAVDCITYLCTSDCLDYLAAIRILQKKGRVANKDNPLVLANLADLYGAAIYVFDCSSSPDIGNDDHDMEEGESSRPKLPEKHLANIVDHLWLLVQQPYPQVRSQAYSSLAGYVPMLLASEDAEVVVDLRQRLIDALLNEKSLVAREGLNELVREVLVKETEDSATWRRTLTISSTRGGGEGLNNRTGGASKPSRKTIKALPSASDIISLYRKQQDAPGLAGACLHAAAAEPQGLGKGLLLELLGDVLIDEDGGGRCVMQRFIAAQSFLRFLPAVISDCVMRSSTSDTSSLAATLSTVEQVEKVIRSIMDDPAARNINNCFLALAALAQALPPQLSHKTLEYMKSLQTMLFSASTDISVDIPTLLIALGISGRCLSLSDAEAVQGLAKNLLDARKAFATRTDLDWCLWGTFIGLGTLTDWTRQQYSPDMTTFQLLSSVMQACLSTFQEGLQSSFLKNALEGHRADDRCGLFTAEGMQRLAARDSGSIVSWEDIDVDEDPSVWEGQEMAVLGASWGLALVAPNLVHAGLELQLLQLYHLLRKAMELNVPGVEVSLARVASLALRSNLISSGDVFEVCKTLGARMDGARPSESAILGWASLVVGMRGMLTLPKGLLEGSKKRLFDIINKKSDQDQSTSAHGRHIAAMLSVYTILAGGGPMVDLMGKKVGEGLGAERTTAAMVIALVESAREGLTSSSQRFRSAAARILGLLVVLRQNEDKGQEEGEAGKPGNRTAVTTNLSSGVTRIDTDTFRLPTNGTLFNMVMKEMINLVIGDSSGGKGVTLEGNQAFIISVLGGLRACNTLRFQHKQMTFVLQNYLKATQAHASSSQLNVKMITACISFAVKMATKDSCYATWLYDVAVSAPVTVLELVVDYLQDFVRLVPSGLVTLLLSSIWSKLIQVYARSRQQNKSSSMEGLSFAYGPLSKVLSRLCQGLSKAKKDTTGSTGGLTGVSWAFLQKNVYAFLKDSSFLSDLSRYLHQVEVEDHHHADIHPMSLLETLADVLTNFSPSEVMESFGLSSSKGGGGGQQTLIEKEDIPFVLLSTMLVSRKHLPVFSLDPIRYCLLGGHKDSASSSSTLPVLCLLAFLARPIIKLGRQMNDRQTQNQTLPIRRDWLKALLDYIQVGSDQQSRLLGFLIHVMAGWCSSGDAPGLVLIQEEYGIQDWRAACRTLTRMEQGLFDIEDWTRIEAILHSSNASLFRSLSLDGEIEVVSRIIKILSAEIKRQGPAVVWNEAQQPSFSSKGMLCWFMMMLLASAIREGNAVGQGSLPMLKVLVGQWGIAAAAAASTS